MGNNGKILIIEAHPSQRDVLKTLLEGRFDLVFKTTVVDGLQAFDNNRHGFTLVIVGAKFDGSLDGLELARSIFEKSIDQALILMSSDTQTLGMAKAADIITLQKPFTMDKLEAAITKALSED